MKKRFGFFLLGTLLCSLACSTPAGRSAGEVIDDSAIRTKVKSKLLLQKEMSLRPIGVTTCEGAVTLTGAVDTPGQRRKAGQIARSVVGVKKVNNLLQVKNG